MTKTISWQLAGIRRQRAEQQPEEVNRDRHCRNSGKSGRVGVAAVRVSATADHVGCAFVHDGRRTEHRPAASAVTGRNFL